ncbi:MAG: hypothetical protein ABIG28_03035 [archaeon]
MFEKVVDAGNIDRALNFARVIGRKILGDIGKKKVKDCVVESGKLYDEDLEEVVLVGRLPSVVVEAFVGEWEDGGHNQKGASERRLERK